LPIAYLVELVLGIPALMVFKRYAIRSLTVFATAGALMGRLVHLSLEAFAENLASHPLTILFNPLASPYLSICVVAGSISAILFRAILFSGAEAARDAK